MARTHKPRRRARRSSVVARLENALPISVEQLDVVQSALGLLHRGELRALEIKEAGVEELERFQSNVQERIGELTTSFDGVLERVGLMRKSKHLELRARAKKRTQKQKPRATKRAAAAAVAAA